jgi:S-adenosylmethionine synthetase
MRKDSYLFTSESVTEGHPDKVADQVSDAVLDAILADDPDGRVAVETLVTTGTVFVAGEITTSCYIEIPQIARKTIEEIGYDDPIYGFDYLSCGVLTSIQQQSPDIALGVNTGGAGDQGMMFGYATNETPELMPMPITLAHRITRHVAELRKRKTLKYLRPDGKSQVTIEYHDGKPRRVDTVVVSVHHGPEVKTERIRADIVEHVVRNPRIIPQAMVDKKTRVLVNPTGRFEVGGPRADTGLTGRKIIADTYGGMGAHGGGAFSGKDPSKVDRSASYMARCVAKNIVAAKLSDRCEVQIAYAIGVAEPISVMVNHFGTGRVANESLVKAVRETFDLTPRGIIRELRLRRPIYRKTAAYGHFGRNEGDFTWEETSKAKELQRRAK